MTGQYQYHKHIEEDPFDWKPFKSYLLFLAALLLITYFL